MERAQPLRKVVQQRNREEKKGKKTEKSQRHRKGKVASNRESRLVDQRAIAHQAKQDRKSWYRRHHLAGRHLAGHR